MKTYYCLELLDWDNCRGDHWRREDEFDTPEAASAFRDEIIAHGTSACYAYYLIVKLGVPTRITKITEEVVHKFSELKEVPGDLTLADSSATVDCDSG